MMLLLVFRILVVTAATSSIANRLFVGIGLAKPAMNFQARLPFSRQMWSVHDRRQLHQSNKGVTRGRAAFS
jgi:hypothetical protein